MPNFYKIVMKMHEPLEQQEKYGRLLKNAVYAYAKNPPSAGIPLEEALALPQGIPADGRFSCQSVFLPQARH